MTVHHKQTALLNELSRIRAEVDEAHRAREKARAELESLDRQARDLGVKNGLDGLHEYLSQLEEEITQLQRLLDQAIATAKEIMATGNIPDKASEVIEALKNALEKYSDASQADRSDS